MPRYEYKCDKCEWHGLLWRTMEQRNSAFCPDCRSEVGRMFTMMGMPNTQIPAVDNHEFNNGQGVFDDGLGELITSRKHRREVMEKKGLHEVSKEDRDLFTKEREHKPMPYEQAKNQFEEAEAMVSNGKWKEGLSEKRVKEIESGSQTSKKE